MNVCFIVDRPHPVLAAVEELLEPRHAVRLASPIETPPTADCYLLKSHTDEGLEKARFLEEQGALVVNSFRATAGCLDRARLAQNLLAARLPLPDSWTFPSLAAAAADRSRLESLPFPAVVKSRHSRRGDLVARLDSAGDLQRLANRSGAEPVVVQRFVHGDGWDLKVWVIGDRIFAARRRSSLESVSRQQDQPVAVRDLSARAIELAHRVGAALDLQLYGIDLLTTEAGPTIVDVNPFPGYRGAVGGAAALASFIDGLGEEARAAA